MPVPIAVLLVSSIAAFPAALNAQPQATTMVNSTGQVRVKQACQPVDVELKKYQQEKDQLGKRHADQHGHMRAQQCEVEKGTRKVPADGPAVSAGQTLKDDDAAKKAAYKRATPVSWWRARASNLLALLTGSGPVVAQAAVSEDPLLVGRWSSPFVIPVVGVSAVMLHTGKVMFWSYDPVNYHNPAKSTDGVGYIWDPVTRMGYNIPPPENIWCAGQTILSDGRVYVAGGNLRYPDPGAPAGKGGWAGPLSNYTFNPLKETWARQPDMSRGRWYPTVTQLADNRVVITSGIDETGTSAINNVVEILTPDPNIDGIGTLQAVSLHNSSGLYPLQFLMPSGKMLEAGPNAQSSFQFDPLTYNWSNVPAMTSDHYYLGNGISYTDASLSTPQQLIMVAGGYAYSDVPPLVNKPLASNEFLDGYNPAAGWAPFPEWKTPRHNANTVLLPDGTMLTVGGNKGLYGYDEALLDAEIYNKPALNRTGSWQPVAKHSVQAAYHSTAILLPDATVLLSQDDMDYSAQAAFEHKAQVYSPPYLFKGPQPKIISAPSGARYGQTFAVTTDRGTMSSAMLVAPGATTHSNDMHQRAIKLKVKATNSGIDVTMPSSSAVAPPGYYMLFVLDSAGIPSVAKFVRVT